MDSGENIRPLLEQTADSRNVVRAFRSCARGKRASRGYQMMALDLSQNIVTMVEQLATGSWPWQPYHRFIVCDPKRRTIYAAPFRDRVVHHAIHQIIFPFIDDKIPRSSWACRKHMGSRGAAASLAGALSRLGAARHVIKLDVRNYFASIDHQILLDKFAGVLPDRSLDPLLISLLDSHPEYRLSRCGIPLGNLTSQLFANFYLCGADLLCELRADQVFYIRYMDDMVLASNNKKAVHDLKDELLAYCHDSLKLSLPHRKCVYLGNDPVPFLGYLLRPNGYAVLARTSRRHQRQIRKMTKSACRESEIAQVKVSFAAFTDLTDALLEHAPSFKLPTGD